MKYNQYNFKIKKKTQDKIFSFLKLIKIYKIFLDKSLQNKFNVNGEKQLQKLFIKNSELIINGLVKTYFYYNNLKKQKLTKNIIKQKIYKRITNLFGKTNSNDINTLIFIYENVINSIIDLIIKSTNFIGGSGFFASDPDFPYPPPETFIQKVLTYLPILHYLENKYPWTEWLFLIIDIAMDAAGMIPLVGNFVDLAGVVLAILRKDWINALIALIQAIPAAGIFAGPIGIAQQIVKAYQKYTEVKGSINTTKQVMTLDPRGFIKVARNMQD